MKNFIGSRIILSILIICIAVSGKTQDSSKIFFTTAVGLLHPVSSFSKAYKNSLALNSGIEYRFSKHYFAQFVLDFNAVKYNQQIKDAGSAYLFQNTSSSVFLAGINLGRNFPLISSRKLFASPYIGAGYANIGEPRLMVDDTRNIINQEVTRMRGIFGRAGTRVGYSTQSKILQTIYADVSYWAANITVQESRPTAFSFLAGTRIGF
ncbi:MAG: hypothetical protein H7X88_08775 [Gloeobacteraceae cyanobacterium ES-bin-316]|nr:hypothetical protein [Ferruginibacter sp.]